MSKQLIVLSTGACIVLAFVVAWLFAIPLERAFLLGPVIVVAFGLLAMVFVLLIRAAIQNVSELQNPRRFWIGLAAACVVIAVLSLLGLELPREGG